MLKKHLKVSEDKRLVDLVHKNIDESSARMSNDHLDKLAAHTKYDEMQAEACAAHGISRGNEDISEFAGELLDSDGESCVTGTSRASSVDSARGARMSVPKATAELPHRD